MRIRRALTVFAALVCIATCLTASVFGQNIQRPDQKVDQGRRVEARIDPATGALSIEIPIRVYTGRGGMRIPISFSYSSKVWQMDYAWYSASPAGCEQQQPNFCTEQFSVHSPRFAGETASGWTIGMGLLRTVGDLQTYSGLGRECDGSTWSCGGASKYVNRLNLLLPDGSTHEFRRDDGVHTAPDETGAYYSVDGTGMRYEGGVLYLPDGSKHEATKHTDRNGNTLTLASGVWTDTLGRSFTLPQLNSSPSEGDISYVLPGIGGQNDSYTLKWRKLEDVRTAPSQPLRYTGNLGHSGQVFSPYLFDGNNDNKFVVGFHNPVLLSEIVLPNNETYKFTYNIHGEIDKITYPTGAYERFSHAQVNARQGLSFPYDQANRGVVERWVSPSGQSSDEQHWTYTPTGATSTVTQPDGMSLVSTYHLGRDLSDANRVFGFDDARAGKPKDEKVYASGGALKARTLSKWEQLGGVTFNGVTPDSRATRDPYLSKQISIVFETGTYALMQMTEYEYDSHSDPSYFAHLNVKRTKGYGFIPVPKTTAEDPNVSFDTLAAMFTNSDLVSVTETDYSYDSSYKARGILGRPVASRVMDPQNTSSVFAKSEYVYDEAAYFDGSYTTATNWENPNSTLRGNVTTTKTWHAETSSWIESHTMFDHFGNVTKVWDTSGDATRFVETQYDAVYKYAYSTKTKAPAPDPAGVNGTTVGSEINRVYDFTTGLLTSVTDAHGQTAYTEYNDALLRPTRIVPPSGGSVTETIYNDTPGNIWVKLRQQIDAHTWGERTTYFDNSGRALKSRTKDQQGDVVSEVRYDVFGRVEKTSNPYRVDVNGNPVETVYWSKVRYDEVNRVVETYAPAPDGQTGQSLGTAEFGISTLPGLVGAYAVSIDASGRKSRAISGTYGLMRVDEATAKEGTVDQDLGTLANPTQPTFYHYNIKGELARINQGTQDRYFLYDSLGRLIRVRQPEQTPNANLATTGNPENNQWTAGYTYDVFGNVTSVTDAKNITITNFYDKAGRTTKRTYSDGTPQVEFFYDGKGLPQVPQFSNGALTKVMSSVSEDRFTSFDNHGRLLASQQITDGQTYTFGYKYNLSGGLIEQTYPSGRIVRDFLDGDGGLATVTSKAANGVTKIVASDFDYAATGAVKKMKLGNSLWETAEFNHLHQLTQIGLGTTQANRDLFKIDYEYGELNPDGTTVDTAKNIGSIARTTTTIPTTSFVQAFKYDSINRLTEAVEKTGSTQNWKQTFGYDRYGNRTSRYQIVGTTELPINNITQPTIDQTNNRFTTGQGYVFDLNGNLIQDAEGRSFTFNGDDKQTEVRNTSTGQVIGQYSYDGSGARVKKHVPSTGETTIFVYDAGGALAAEYSTVAPPQTPTTSYLTTDHLGSPRVITNASGQVIARRDFMPFGEELGAGVGPRTEALKYSYSGSDNIRKRFTGYEKDDETGLDFAEARMYQNKHGRFTAVDPLLASASATNPQTFNRYTYTGNDPVNYADPSGLLWCRQSGSGSQNTYWSGDSPCDNGYDIVDGQDMLITEGDLSHRSTNGSAGPGTVVTLNADGTVTVLDPAVPGHAARIANATGATVQSAQAEVGSTTAAVLNTSLTPASRPLQDLLPLPCVSGSDSACGSGNLPYANPLTGGASSDDILLTTQVFLDGAAATEIPIISQGTGLISAGVDFSRGDNISGLMGLGGLVPVAGNYLDALKIARRLERARELGAAGERAAGITAAKKAIDVDGRKLFPDEVTTKSLTEVKNVGKLSYTRQLRDYQKYAASQPKKLDFVLWTRPDTKLSGPLREAIDSGDIIHKCFGGRCR